MRQVTLIVPILNEVDNIENFLFSVDKVILDLKLSYTFSYLFVMDPSKDGTEELLFSLTAKRHDISVIKMSRRFGHQNALFCGLQNSKSSIIVMMDADLQHPPKLIYTLLNEYEKGFKIVNTQRNTKAKSDKSGRFSRLFYNVINMFVHDFKMIKSSPDFRLIADEPLNYLRSLDKFHDPFIRGMVPYLGFPNKTILYNQTLRSNGKSKFGSIVKFKLAFNILVSFTSFLLKMAVIFAILSFVLALFLSVFSLYEYFVDNSTPAGWTTNMIVFLYISSVQLFFLGILGIYVNRIYKIVQGLPPYIIERRYN
jgi:glycosyltransferase involved in cell wall biosynthesis